jgi:hypothetical protein
MTKKGGNMFDEVLDGGLPHRSGCVCPSCQNIKEMFFYSHTEEQKKKKEICSEYSGPSIDFGAS